MRPINVENAIYVRVRLNTIQIYVTAETSTHFKLPRLSENILLRDIKKNR